MKLHFDKNWLDKFDDDVEEPGGVMACSPFIYAWMQADVYAEMNETAKFILNLSLIEYTRDRQHLGDSDDRFIWMLDRVKRHAQRVIRNLRNGDPNCITENQ